jgi:hypothetical protein
LRFHFRRTRWRSDLVEREVNLLGQLCDYIYSCGVNTLNILKVVENNIYYQRVLIMKLRYGLVTQVCMIFKKFQGPILHFAQGPLISGDGPAGKSDYE